MQEPVIQTLVNEIAAFILIGAVISLGLLIVAYLVLLEMLFYRLRSEYADHYREIGAPSLFLNNSISKGFGVVRYLLDKGYLAVSDRRINRLGEYARRLFYVITGVFCLALLLYAVFAITSKRPI